MTIPMDLILIVDTTSSMSSLIRTAQQIAVQAVQKVSQSKGLDTRISLIQFRDHPPEDHSFASKISLDREHYTSPKCVQAIKALRTDGGGDGPESGFDAINDIAKLSWGDQDEASIKIGFFIGDAPIIGTPEAIPHLRKHSQHKVDYNCQCRCGLSLDDMERVLEEYHVELIGYALSHYGVTDESFKHFCADVVNGSSHAFFEKMVEEIVKKADEFIWATEVLLPVLEESPFEKVSSYCEQLDEGSQRIYQGIEILNQFGFTEKLQKQEVTHV